MGLLQNIRILNAQPIKHGAGGTAGAIPVASCVDRGHSNRAELAQNMCFGEAYIDPKGGFPYGYAPPYQIKMPIKEGGMSCYSGITGTGTASVDLKLGRALATTLTGSGEVVSSSNLTGVAILLATLTGSGAIFPGSVSFGAVMEATVEGSGEATGNCILLSFLEALVEGSGTILDVNLQTTVGLVATLTGEGDVIGAMTMLTSLAAELEGSGTIDSPAIEMLAQLSSTLSGSGTISEANLTGLALLACEVVGQGAVDALMRSDCYMGATITSSGEVVTAQSCAEAVWSAMAASFNEPGTTGNKLNSASAAGDPWTAELPGSYAPGSAGAMLSEVGFMTKILVNKREIKKVGDDWTLFVYDDNGTTPILSKVLKDVTGAQIADLSGGVLAKEEASSVS
jgi:hypothetical protein